MMMRSERTAPTAQNDNSDSRECEPFQYLRRTKSQPQSQRLGTNNTPLRRGKWSPEEETYALAAIHDFNSGYLDALPGSTLRTYLSEKLQCDPMRITKKFTGEDSIGKKVFHPAVKDNPKTLKEIEDSQENVGHLYQKWKQRLESQEQEMARKSMAATAVSGASSWCGNPHFPLLSTASSSSHLLRGAGCMRVPPEMKNMVNTNKGNVQCDKAKNDITKTASWLDRADNHLSKNTTCNETQRKIEEEMREISRLITEAPAILAISSDIPKTLSDAYSVESRNGSQASMHERHSCPDLRILCTDTDVEHSQPSDSILTGKKRERSLSDDEKITDSPNNPMKVLASLSSQAAPVPINANDIVKRTTDTVKTHGFKSIPNNNVDAEDAETFVNFLQSVVQVNKK